MQQPLLSVVVPVYRVQHTLERCLNSIVSQSYRTLDIVLVDDGSPDRCPQICDDWAARDSRISVVHQQNAGLSAARNTGIARAKGDYITFVDSDDYLGPGTYAPLMSLIAADRSIDILEFPVNIFEDSAQEHLLRFADQCFDTPQDYWMETRAYLHCFAWNKIFRRQLFAPDTLFPVGRYFEDVHLYPQLLQKATRIATSASGIYHYVWNQQGITARPTGQKQTQLLESYMQAARLLGLKPQPRTNDFFMHMVNVQITTYRLNGQPPLLGNLKLRPVCRLSTWKNRLKATILNLFGIKTLCRLFP